MYRRPTTNEILYKLKEATEALTSKRVRFANLAKVVGELEKLDLGDSAEVWDLIIDLIKEVKSEDYEGKHPPELSTERVVEGKDLWAFAWYSAKLGMRMYLKFVLKDGIFYYVSLHESKFPPRSKGSIK
jgi:Fe-S-cluster formation regulator IscX/YfhJ